MHSRLMATNMRLSMEILTELFILLLTMTAVLNMETVHSLLA